MPLTRPGRSTPHRAEKKLENRLVKDERIEKHERLIEVEKSRCGRSGTSSMLGQNHDLNFYIATSLLSR